MKKQLEVSLREIISGMGSETQPVVILSDLIHGDYTTNIALLLSKELKRNPVEIAEEIASKIELKKQELGIASVNPVAPGFINFTLSPSVLVSQITSPSDKELRGEKVIVEYTDPNPFKEFHIGHVYTNIVGESISRLFEHAGAEVKRVTYQGDVGLHVAKSLWGIQQKEAEGTSLSSLADKTLSEKAQFLGMCYALGATQYEESESAKKEIIEINKAVYAQDPSIMHLYTIGRQWSLEYFDHLYVRLGSKFDRFFFESEVGETGKKLVLEYKAKGIFKDSDGAVIFPGEEYGLHSRVFINSLGLPTYEAKELGLAPLKYEYFPYTLSVIVTGNEITEYFKVLLKCLSLIRPDLSEKTKHITNGMVRLPEGKMSSRTGKVITGEWLLDEAKRRSFEILKSQEKSEGIGEETAEQIGNAAIKYALLKSGVGKDIEFSFDDSITFDGASGPYLQYTFVRTQSVLKKSDGKKGEMKSTELTTEEDILLRFLSRFNEITSQAARTYSPNLLCTYLYELAQQFNLFYQKCPILNQVEEVTQTRLFLTEKTGEVLKKGLYLLGIETPERM